MCKACKRKLIPHPEICPYCHKYSQDYKSCLDCKSLLKTPLEGLVIPFAYTTELKKLILKLKYYHKKDVAQFLWDRLYIAYLANISLQRIVEKSTITVSYVPSHRWRRYFIKWYNQSKVLANKFAKNANLDCISILKKTKHTSSQAKLNREQRLLNLKSVFKKNNKVLLKNYETLILIDDITTTWATLNEMTESIKKTYPKINIWGLVVGRHCM